MPKGNFKNVAHYNVLFECSISEFTVIEPQTKCLGTGDIKYKRSILKDVS